MHVFKRAWHIQREALQSFVICEHHLVEFIKLFKYRAEIPSRDRALVQVFVDVLSLIFTFVTVCKTKKGDFVEDVFMLSSKGF